jgi:hypothetical protein
MKIYNWPGYEEAGMTDESAAELFRQIEGQPTPKSTFPKLYVTIAVIVYTAIIIGFSYTSFRVVFG